jgi:hypothetical protein
VVPDATPSGAFAPHDEIDQEAWVPISEVSDRLTFDVGVEQLKLL